jgi:hypothetical protein
VRLAGWLAAWLCLALWIRSCTDQGADACDGHHPPNSHPNRRRPLPARPPRAQFTLFSLKGRAVPWLPLFFYTIYTVGVILLNLYVVHPSVSGAPRRSGSRGLREPAWFAAGLCFPACSLQLQLEGGRGKAHQVRGV